MAQKKNPNLTLDDELPTALSLQLARDLCTEDYEGDSYLGEYEVKLVDVDTRAPAGRMRLFVTEFTAAEEAGFGALDLLDLKASTEEYSVLLGREAGNYSPAVLKMLGEEFVLNHDMLIIDRLELLPAYRGRGLGLKCMQACIRHFGKACRIAAIKPFPLQFNQPDAQPSEWDTQLALDSLSRQKRASMKRLKQHYGQLGFQHVRGTELMILDLYA